MGLDMYLTAKEHAPYDASRQLDPHFGEFQVGATVYEIGYWRKVNSVHKWFVDNVQNGNDDCGEYVVSEEKLKELRSQVMSALAVPSAASATMPNQSGFFFGSTDYDEYYFDDLRDTIKILDKALKWCELNRKGKFVTIYYSSSW